MELCTLKMNKLFGCAEAEYRECHLSQPIPALTKKIHLLTMATMFSLGYETNISI